MGVGIVGFPLCSWFHGSTPKRASVLCFFVDVGCGRQRGYWGVAREHSGVLFDWLLTSLHSSPDSTQQALAALNGREVALAESDSQNRILAHFPITPFNAQDQGKRGYSIQCMAHPDLNRLLNSVLEFAHKML